MNLYLKYAYFQDIPIFSNSMKKKYKCYHVYFNDTIAFVYCLVVGVLMNLMFKICDTLELKPKEF